MASLSRDSLRVVFESDGVHLRLLWKRRAGKVGMNLVGFHSLDGKEGRYDETLLFLLMLQTSEATTNVEKESMPALEFNPMEQGRAYSQFERFNLVEQLGKCLTNSNKLNLEASSAGLNASSNRYYKHKRQM